jgi:hypothetical protein
MNEQYLERYEIEVMATFKACSAMLKALKEARAAIRAAEAQPTLDTIDAAIAQAEAAGIKAEG